MDSQFLGSAVEMLILEVAGQGPTYGYELAQTVGERSNGYFELKEGSLYPALHRLEYRGWIRAEWGASENNRRARFYSLTAAGRKQLNAELENWDRLAGAVNLVLQRT
jgi:PadR family transcriptional regulator PadR